MFAKRSVSLIKNTMVLQRSLMMQNQMRHFAIVKKFTKSHEWITLDTDSGIATIGITNHAQEELGDIVHIDLPSVG